MTYAARYPHPVLRYDAPLGTDRVSIDLDPMLVRAVIEGIQRDVRQPAVYHGMRNRDV
jgi:hypothetical protein